MLAPVGSIEIAPLRLELHGLTRREREVTRLLARGASTGEIARALTISTQTVKDHAKAICAEFEAGNRSELIASSSTSTTCRRSTDRASESSRPQLTKESSNGP